MADTHRIAKYARTHILRYTHKHKYTQKISRKRHEKKAKEKQMRGGSGKKERKEQKKDKRKIMGEKRGKREKKGGRGKRGRGRVKRGRGMGLGGYRSVGIEEGRTSY